MNAHKLIEQSRNIICSTDSKGDFTYVNPAFCKVLGYTKKQLKTKNFSDLLHPEDFESTDQKYKDLLAGLDTINFTNRYVNKDGTTHHILWNAFYEPDEKLIYGVGNDVTAQILAEQKLNLTERKYTSLFNTMSDCFMLVELIRDKKGTVIDLYYLDVNPAFEKLVGKPREELINKRAKELFAVIDDYWLEVFNEVNKTGESINYENFSGEMKGQYAINAWKSKEDVISVTFRNVTEKKQIQDALKESEEKFKKLSNLTFEGIIIHKNGITLDHNESFAKMFGYEGEYLKGLNAIELVIAATHQQLIYDNSRKDITQPYVAIGKKKDGTEFPIEIEGKLFTDEKGETYRVAAVRDITARVESEKVQKRLLQQNELAIQVANLAVWSVDLASNKITWSDQMLENFGLSKDEITGNLEDLIKYIHPEDVGRMNDMVTKVLKGHQKATVQFRIIRKTGEIRHMEGSASPVYNDENKLVQIMVVDRDITENINAEIEIVEKNILLKQTNKITKIGGWELDLTTMSGIFTEETYNIYGISDYSEIVPMEEGIKFYTPEAQPIIKKAVDDALENDIPYDLELPFINRQGENIWVRTKGEAIFKNGKAVKLCGTIQDITDRKINEQKLRESEEKYRSFFENAGLGIGYYSPEGIVLSFNSVALEALDGVLEDFEGKSVIDIFPKDTADLILNRFQTILTTCEIQSFEDFVELPSGDQWFLSTYCVITDSNQDTQGIQIISQNITEKKLAEIALLESKATANAILNSIPSSVCVIDETGNIIQTNEVWNEFGLSGGYKRVTESFVDYNYLEVCKSDIQDEHAKSVYEGLQNLLTGKLEEFELEYPCHAPDKEQWFLLRANQMKTKEKQIVISHIDVTNRKQLEDRQHQLLQQSNLAIQTAQLGVWTLDIASGDLTWNDQLLDIYGLSRTEFENNLDGWRKQLHPEDTDFANKELSKIFDGETVFGIEFRIINKDGEIRYIDASGVPVYNDQKKLIKAIGINRDITAQKVKEAVLLRSDRVFNLAIDMFCIAGYDGYFKYLNPAWKRTLGWSKEEMLAKPWIDFVHPEDQNRTDNIKTIITEGREVLEFENRYICKDGSVKWLSWKSQPFPAEQTMVGVARDITEEKAKEQALKQSEAQLLKAQQIAKLGSWYLDIATNEVSWTEELFTMFGLDANVTAPRWDEQQKYYTKKSWTILTSAVEKAAENGSSYDLELKIIKEDKTHAWIMSRGEALKNESGEIYALSGIAQDITDSVVANSQIVKLSKAVEQSPESIVITNPDGIIEYVNPTFSKISGYSTKEAIGVKPGILQSGIHSREFYVDMWNTISSGKIWKGEFNNKKKNGELYWENASIAPIKNDEGSIINYVAIKEDITEKKKIERDLSQAKERAEQGEKYLDSIIKNIGNPVFVKDDQSRILIANDAFCELFNLSLKDIIGKTLVENVASEEMESFLKDDKEVLATGVSKTIEETLTLTNNKTKIISTRKNRYIDQSGRKFLVGTIVDITEITQYRNHLEDLVHERTSELEIRTEELRKANEDLKAGEENILQALEKERELGELKTRFVSTASHQFRTPLTVIRSNVELMEMNLNRIQEDQRKQFKKYFERINTESDRMTQIMEDVLILGKISSSTVPIHREMIDVVSIAQNLTAILNDENKTPSKIRLEVINEPQPIFIDESHINHILLNVLGNARKYSLDRGDVLFKITFHKDELHLTIKDKGIGMSEKDVQTIFQPFTRGANTEGIQGTGLGMSIVDEYVNLNHGKINIKSVLNVGTTVDISFPYKDK